MKKRSLLSGLLVIMVLAMTMLFAGCGSEPATLEEWIASDTEAQETIDGLNTDELSVTIEDNTVVYTYTYPQTIDASLVDAVADQLESYVDDSASTFTSLADTLSEQSGIEGVAVQVIYLNGDGTEMMNKTF